MSYWVYLEDAQRESMGVKSHEEGSTYTISGTDRAELNVTYNYSGYYREHLDSELGLRWLHGRTASETIERLEAAVAALGTERSPDHWEGSPGNAGHALSVLLGWARQHPDGVWFVS